MAYEIRVANEAQALLLDIELKPQISDGYWNNAHPYDHYVSICSATVIVDPNNIGLNFKPARKYNFANRTLLNGAGERMRLYVVLRNRFPILSIEALKNLNNGALMWIKRRCGCLQSFQTEMKNVCGVHNFEEQQRLLSTLDFKTYQMKDLKKDLKELNFIFTIIH